MDQNITKMLYIGAGVLLTIVVIIAAINLANMGQSMTEEAAGETARLANELARSKFSAYDGTTVSGTSVVSAISKYRDMEGDIIIEVETGTGSTYQYLSTGTISGGVVTGSLTERTTTTNDIANAKDSTHARYVNPAGQFSAKIVYDENDVVRAIVFEQE